MCGAFTFQEHYFTANVILLSHSRKVSWSHSLNITKHKLTKLGTTSTSFFFLEPGPLSFFCNVLPSAEGEPKGTLMNISRERPVLPQEQSCVCEVTEVTVVTPRRE